jgi:hypothetical protein
MASNSVIKIAADLGTGTDGLPVAWPLEIVIKLWTVATAIVPGNAFTHRSTVATSTAAATAKHSQPTARG